MRRFLKNFALIEPRMYLKSETLIASVSRREISITHLGWMVVLVPVLGSM